LVKNKLIPHQKSVAFLHRLHYVLYAWFVDFQLIKRLDDYVSFV